MHKRFNHKKLPQLMRGFSSVCFRFGFGFSFCFFGLLANEPWKWNKKKYIIKKAKEIIICSSAVCLCLRACVCFIFCVSVAVTVAAPRRAFISCSLAVLPTHTYLCTYKHALIVVYACAPRRRLRRRRHRQPLLSTFSLISSAVAALR